MFKKRWSLMAMAALFTVTAVSFPGHAQRMCENVHQNVKPHSLEWRVESKNKEMLDENGNLNIDAPAGALFISEQPLAPKARTAVMELVRMINFTRSMKFSFKEYEGKKTGSMVLGLPLEKGWSVEVTYITDNREYTRFRPKSLVLITPGGDAHQVRNTLQKLDGTLDTSINFDLNDYPGINLKDFKLHIPAEISGEALGDFAKIAPKLDLITKDELREISKTNNYFKLKSLIHYRAVKAKISEYMVKGYFKTFFKWTVGPILSFAIIFGAVTTFPNQVKAAKGAVTNVISSAQERWLTASLDKALQSPTLPQQIKGQIQDLKMDFDRTMKEQSAVNPMTRQHSPDLNAPNKFQLSKDQYMWVTKAFNAEQNREMTLLFVTQDNKYGQLEYAVTEIDPVKYSALINYLGNRGQMLPIQIEGVAQ